MKTLSILEFRKKAKSVLASVQKGQRILLTYRGKPVATLEPVRQETPDEQDPFYAIDKLAGEEGLSITNDEIDQVLYGQ